MWWHKYLRASDLTLRQQIGIEINCQEKSKGIQMIESIFKYVKQ